VVAGQQHPAHVRGRLHARQGLAVDAIARFGIVEHIPRNQDRARTFPPGGGGQAVDRIEPRLLQRRARLVGQAAERLAELPVRRVNEPHVSCPGALYAVSERSASRRAVKSELTLR
jgi:hypothetical protein